MRFEDLPGQTYATLAAGGRLPVEAIEKRIGDRRYVTFAREGVTLTVDDDGVVHSVQFYGEPAADAARFDGTLPAGLRFDMDRDAARVLLGPPDQSGEAKELPILGRMPAWDKWAARVSVHAEYAFDQASIRLVTMEISHDPA